MFTLIVWNATHYGAIGLHLSFPTERAAREAFNHLADGSRTITLRDPAGETVVESSWPVLMVA